MYMRFLAVRGEQVDIRSLAVIMPARGERTGNTGTQTRTFFLQREGKHTGHKISCGRLTEHWYTPVERDIYNYSKARRGVK